MLRRCRGKLCSLLWVIVLGGMIFDIVTINTSISIDLSFLHNNGDSSGKTPESLETLLKNFEDAMERRRNLTAEACRQNKLTGKMMINRKEYYYLKVRLLTRYRQL